MWLIRLASGATSVGIVADPAFHAFDGFNTLAKATSWLAEHEPQCAAEVAQHDIMDFRVMKHYSHTVTKVFDGRDRWCLTGDSGVFLDPLYSSGLDLVAIGNGLVTDMIARDLDGEDVVARSAISDSLFRSLTDMWLNIYRDQYVLMGSPTVMSAKVIWDIAFYWGFVGFLYSNDRFTRVADDQAVVPYLEGTHRTQQPHAGVLPRVGRSRELRRAGGIRRPVLAAELHGDASPLDDGEVRQIRRPVRRERAASSSGGRPVDRRRCSRTSRRASPTTTSCGRCRRGRETRFCETSGPSTATSRRPTRSAGIGSSVPHPRCDTSEARGLSGSDDRRAGRNCSR